MHGGGSLCGQAATWRAHLMNPVATGEPARILARGDRRPAPLADLAGGVGLIAFGIEVLQLRLCPSALAGLSLGQLFTARRDGACGLLPHPLFVAVLRRHGHGGLLRAPVTQAVSPESPAQHTTSWHTWLCSRSSGSSSRERNSRGRPGTGQILRQPVKWLRAATHQRDGVTLSRVVTGDSLAEAGGTW